MVLAQGLCTTCCSCRYSDFLVPLLGNHFTGWVLYAGQGGMMTWQEIMRRSPR